MTDNPEKSKKSRVKLPDLDADVLYSKQLNSSSAKQQYSLSK